MHYCVVHVEKYKHSQIKALQKHNLREWNCSNVNINKQQSELNFNLHCDNIRCSGDFVADVDSKLSIIKKKVRSDAVVLCEAVVTSDKDFFKDMSEDEIKKFFKTAYENLCKRYGKENVVSAVVHLDESTPHMHFSFVPIVRKLHKTKYKSEIQTCLSAKSVLDRDSLLKLQEEFPQEMRKSGYDLVRGELSDKTKIKHVSAKKYISKQSRDVQNLKIDNDLLDKLIRTASVVDIGGWFKKDERLCFPAKYSKIILNCLKQTKNSVFTAKEVQKNLDRKNLLYDAAYDELNRMKEQKKYLNELVVALGGKSKSDVIINDYKQKKLEEEQEKRRLDEKEKSRIEFEEKTRDLIPLKQKQKIHKKSRVKENQTTFEY